MKQSSHPRISVIIPTKNRAEYLRHTLRTCSGQDYDNLEVIVSDDGSTDHTAEVVHECHAKDARIRYLRLPKGSGMLDNFEYALDQVREGYVIALGGDDGLLPGGVSRMRDTLVETNMELLTWQVPAYFYPGVKMSTSQLVLPANCGRLREGVAILDSARILARQVRDLHYVADPELPMFYVKGLVSMRLVHRVRSRTPSGRFYACATPDGYSGIVLAGEVERYAYSSTPFTLHGVSPSSQGVNYLGGNHEARKRSDEFFQQAQLQPMHADLASQPYSPLIALMTADYLLTARDLPGWPGRFPPLDYKNVLMRALRELQDGLLAYDVVERELSILHAIAKHHNMSDFFRQAVRHSRRNVRKVLEGNAFSPLRYYWNASACGIENVYDASYMVYFAYQVLPKLSLSAAWRAAWNSVRYKMLSHGRGEAFPPESQWMGGLS